MYSESQKRATTKWEKQNYEQIRFTAPKGFKERLKVASKNAGCSSMRQFIISSLENAMGQDRQ